jgi:Na+/H+-dicarboxylate symporter
LGVQRKISSFVLPMGYSFNLDGSMTTSGSCANCPAGSE